MVTIHFFVIVLLSLLSFSLGRLAGRMESSIIMTRRLNSIIMALKRVETISSLKGEDLTNVSSEELVRRINKQMELDDGQN
jgi:hypothetical protein